jgi:hypothetical protein
VDVNEKSREFGVKLARALRQRAIEAASEHVVDARYVMLGAAEYLRETAERQLNPELDDSRTAADEREN